MGNTWKKYLSKLDDTKPEIQILALEKLAELKADLSINDIISLIEKDSTDYHVKVEAIKALGIIGNSEAGPSLLKILKTDDVPLIMEAVIALGKLAANGFDQAIPHLEELIENENFRIRKYSIQALGLAKDNEILPKLYESLKDDDINLELKEIITTTIGNIGGSRALNLLLNLIFPNDEFPKLNMEIRRAAINSLGEARDPGALELLGKVYSKSENKVIQKYAKVAIEKTIEGAKQRYQEIKDRAKEILKN